MRRRTIRRVSMVAVTVVAFGLFLPLPAAQASCVQEPDPLLLAWAATEDPTVPEIGPDIGPDAVADPCVTGIGAPGPGELEGIRTCQGLATTYVRPWLVAEHLGVSVSGILYRWTGSGYVSIPKACATEATAHTRLGNTAASVVETVKRGRTTTETEQASSAHRVSPEALADVTTAEFWQGPPPTARGPAVVTVQTWGSFLFRPTGRRASIDCMERKFLVQADPAASYGTVIQELSYGPCTPA